MNKFLHLERLSIGTAQQIKNYGIYREEIPKNFSLCSLLDLAKKFNIDMIDTAQSYDNAEENLGKCDLNNFRVITKISPCSPSDIAKNFMNSLKKLGIDSIYSLMIHDVNTLNKKTGFEIYEIFQDFKQKKLIEKIGVSIYSPDDYFNLSSKYSFDLVQLPLNAFDNRAHNSGLIDHLYNNKIEIHARSVFLQGILINSVEKLPRQLNALTEPLTEWHGWLDKNNIPPVLGCLVHVLSYKKIAKFIIGIEKRAQLQEVGDLLLNLDLKKITIAESFNIIDDNLIDPRKW